MFGRSSGIRDVLQRQLFNNSYNIPHLLYICTIQLFKPAIQFSASLSKDSVHNAIIS